MTPKGGDTDLAHDAAKLVAHPDAALKQVLDTIAASSHSSQSQTRHDRTMADGSMICVTSFQGAAPKIWTYPPPPPTPSSVDPRPDRP